MFTICKEIHVITPEVFWFAAVFVVDDDLLIPAGELLHGFDVWKVIIIHGIGPNIWTGLKLFL